MELEEQYKRNMAELREYDFQLSRARALDALAPTRQVDENGPSNSDAEHTRRSDIQEDVALREDMEKVYVNFLVLTSEILNWNATNQERHRKATGNSRNRERPSVAGETLVQHSVCTVYKI